MSIFSSSILALFRSDFGYDPDTGIFTWRRHGSGHGGAFKPGDKAGTKGDGRVVLGTNGVSVRAHTVAYWFMTGEDVPTGMMIDHIDRNPNNNRWENLRVVTQQVNNRNIGPKATNKSGCMGVLENKRSAGPSTWSARIGVKGAGIILLGTYTEYHDAVLARLHGEIKHYGEITSTHMAHIYEPDRVPVPRSMGQWRDDERNTGWRTRNGISTRVTAAELERHNAE